VLALATCCKAVKVDADLARAFWLRQAHARQRATPTARMVTVNEDATAEWWWALGVAMAQFPSEAWVHEWLTLADRSERFRRVSQDWEGDVGCIIRADIGRGLFENACIWFHPESGRIEGKSYGDCVSAEGATIVWSGPYVNWKGIVSGTLHPIKATIQNKLSVSGQLGKLLHFAGAIDELQRVARQVPTEFVDEPTP
jgi:putative sterol carrier protein